MRLLLALACLAVAGCAHRGLAGLAPKGRLFVEIRVTDIALLGPTKGDTGLFFFMEDAPGGSAPQVTGYHLANGRIVAMTQLGSASPALLQAWDALQLVPFDFNEEANAAEERRIGAITSGIVSLAPFDGAEYQVAFNTPRGRLEWRQWNTPFYLTHDASYSEKIAQVKAAIDILTPWFEPLKFSW